MDETSRKRPLEEIDPSSTVSASKRSRVPALSGRAQRQSSSSSFAETTSTASSRDSSDDESSNAEDGSDNESTSSAGTTTSSTSSSSSSSSSSPSSQRGNEERRELEDGENDVDESDESPDDEITNVPARPKPQIRRVNGDSSILSRISDFLPRLKAANEDLQRNIQTGKSKDIVMDDVNEENEGQYIEMNLGLGVLEEPNTEGSDELSTENDGSYPSDNEPGPSTTSPRTHRDSNVLDKLMGKKAKSKRPAIEEMED